MAIRRKDSKTDHHTTRELVLSLTGAGRKGGERGRKGEEGEGRREGGGKREERW